MSQNKYIVPKWIRLRDEALPLLDKEYQAAYDEGASEKWIWFVHLIDFQESCNRTSSYQTFKTRVVRFLLFLAEKVARL